MRHKQSVKAVSVDEVMRTAVFDSPDPVWFARFIDEGCASGTLKTIRYCFMGLKVQASYYFFVKAIRTKQLTIIDGLRWCVRTLRRCGLKAPSDRTLRKRNFFKKRFINRKLLELTIFLNKRSIFVRERVIFCNEGLIAFAYFKQKLMGLQICIKHFRSLIPDGFKGSINELFILRPFGGESLYDRFYDVYRIFYGCGGDVSDVEPSVDVGHDCASPKDVSQAIAHNIAGRKAGRQ